MWEDVFFVLFLLSVPVGTAFLANRGVKSLRPAIHKIWIWATKPQLRSKRCFFVLEFSKNA